MGTFTGNSSGETLAGGPDNDTIDGKAGNDILNGVGGDDTIIGGAGDDTLTGGPGNDIFTYNAQGFGNDTITDFTLGQDRIDLSALNVADLATLSPFIGQAGSDTLMSLKYLGFDETIRIQGILPGQLTADNFVFNTSTNGLTVTGQNAQDVLFGGNGNDTIDGKGGNDVITAGAGNDTIIGNGDDDKLTGGAGNDIFAYTARGFDNDTITDFTLGQDRIDLSALNVADLATLSPFIGQAGNDTLISLKYLGFDETIRIQGILPGQLTADNFVFNTSTNGLTVTGQNAQDVLFGGNGNDTIDGKGGNDVITAGAGNDTIIGNGDDDKLTGGAGNDIFAYTARGFDNDTITDFTLGQDRIDLSALNVADLATLSPFIGQAGSDTLISLKYLGFDETIRIQGILPGQLTADSFVFNTSTNGLTVTGQNAQDVLFGGNGNDTIDGKGGNDVITAGAGNDTIIAGPGDDMLFGGAGQDTAVFSGTRANYQITVEGAGYRVVDQRSALNDGSDHVEGVEQFQFADGTFVGADLHATPPVATSDGFRLFAADGFAGKIGGTGAVVGTNGFQDISLIGAAGSIGFDASFNRGGDIIRLAGAAATFDIARSGSSAVLVHGDESYTIPAGTAGTRLVFDDGVRTLLFDTASASLKIGSQSFGNTATAITAAADNTVLPTGSDPAALGRLYLGGGDHVFIAGHYSVVGTVAGEQVSYTSGDIALDPSFNRGGDTLFLPHAASTYSAHLSGSSVVLSSADGAITIPVGTAGMTLDFAGDDRTLAFSTASSSVMIDGQTITASNVVLMG